MKAVLEKVPASWSQSFATLAFSFPRFDCPYHYHPEVELTLIQEGTGHRLVGDHLDTFSPGDLVLHGSGLPHSYFHPEIYDGGATSLVVQFDPAMSGGVLKHAPEFRTIRDLLERASRGFTFSPEIQAEATGLLQRMPQAADTQRWLLLIQSLDLLAQDAEATPLASTGYRPRFNAAQSERLDRVCTWVTGHFLERITLDEVARRAGMTPPAFSRFFRKATSRTFVDFVIELRVGHACQQLLASDESITEIAFTSGFENLSHFNRCFKRLRGITPRNFRAAARWSG